MEDTRKNWRQIQQYFNLFDKILFSLGHKVKRHLISRSIVARLIDYYMGHHAPLWKGHPKEHDRISLGNFETNEVPNLSDHMSTLRNAIMSCHNRVSEEKNLFPGEQLLSLTKLDNQYLYIPEFYSSLLKQCYSFDTNRSITRRLCYEDEERTRWVLDRFFSSIFRSERDQFPDIPPVLGDLLCLNDSLRMWRVALFIGHEEKGIIFCIDDLINNETYKSIQLLNMLIEVMKSDPVVAGYILSQDRRFEKKINLIFKDKIRDLEHDYFRTNSFQLFLELRDLKEAHRNWCTLLEKDIYILHSI